MSLGRAIYTSALGNELHALVGERRCVVICSEEISRYGLVSQLLESDLDGAILIHVPDGENQKDFETYRTILQRLGEIKFPRDGVIVGLGGGATTDLAGFVAATWMRGIDWIAVPTTLAGMVDAAIGGKTGINLSSGKNLVGAFHLPLATLIDQRMLTTLSRRDISAGLAEVLKCGFISDGSILDIAERLSEAELSSPGSSPLLGELIKRSATVKEEIVSSDLRESAQRAILNYGHTLGHAIEIIEKYRLRHGEAVAIGMVFAAELSHRIHGLSREVVDRHRAILSKFDLPTSYSSGSFDSLQEVMERDKKVKDGNLRFVTLKASGKAELTEKIPIDTARDVFNERIASA